MTVLCALEVNYSPYGRTKPFPFIFLQWPNDYVRRVSRDHQHKYIRTNLNPEFILHLLANWKGWLLKQCTDHYNNVQLLIHITFVAESFSQEFMLQWPSPYVRDSPSASWVLFLCAGCCVQRAQAREFSSLDCVGAHALMDCYSRWLPEHTGKRCIQGAKGRGLLAPAWKGVITALKWRFITLKKLAF